MEVSVLNIKGEDTGRKALLNDAVYNIEPNDLPFITSSLMTMSFILP